VTVPVTIGDVVNGTIAVSGEQDQFSFVLPVATRLHFDSRTDTGSIFWSLAGPAGTHVSNRSFNNSDSFDIGNPVINLPAGTYTIIVDAAGDLTGTYGFRLLDLSAALPITPNTSISGSLDPATESDLYRFDVVAGERFYFDVTTAVSNATWRLIDPFNNVVISSGLETMWTRPR
jgi:hypothetical protein